MFPTVLLLACIHDGSGVTGWIPDDWRVAQARGDLLLAAPGAAGAQIGNGYVGAFVPVSVPGSAGPVEFGVEHVAGVFTGQERDKGYTPHVSRMSKLQQHTRTARSYLFSFIS